MDVRADEVDDDPRPASDESQFSQSLQRRAAAAALVDQMASESTSLYENFTTPGWPSMS